MCALFFQAEDGIRDSSVTGVQTCALLFQAEDGIRDSSVTGVQTCALPILWSAAQWLISRASRVDHDSSAHPEPPPMALASAENSVRQRSTLQIGRASCRERV